LLNFLLRAITATSHLSKKDYLMGRRASNRVRPQRLDASQWSATPRIMGKLVTQTEASVYGARLCYDHDQTEPASRVSKIV
jgi:hypothetical protein